MKILQRVRFLIKIFTTRQILKKEKILESIILKKNNFLRSTILKKKLFLKSTISRKRFFLKSMILNEKVFVKSVFLNRIFSCCPILNQLFYNTSDFKQFT